MTSFQVAGATVELPVRVREASSGTALFDVDAAAAQQLVPDAFEVVETAPGRATLALALVDYRDNDLGAYLEVGVILFVRPAGGPTDGSADGTHIVHLPVDQPFTCEAGRVVWGFPKTLQSIRRDDADGSSTWTLEMDGELALRLTVPRGGDDELPAAPMTTYTLRDGVPHATRFTQWGTGSTMRYSGDGVRLELGPHRVGEELASLGLPAPAVMSTWTQRMQATFEAPVPL